MIQQHRKAPSYSKDLDRDSDTNMMLFLFLFGLTLGAVSPSDEREVKLQRGNCPMFWFSFNGRCYKYVSTRLTWADAELYCVSQRANLVSIHSLQEQNFVKNLIKNFDHTEGRTWIGLSDTQKSQPGVHPQSGGTELCQNPDQDL
uniref:C-type lectin domain-containing protein n=1 Tax=Lates calcarifer TaxID=8187 RepID=A0A4W6EUK8_LATCA